jgi:hypothetical protein
MPEVENTVATSFENFDLVIETFHEAAIFSMDKKVCDFLPTFIEQADEVSNALHITLLNLLYPMQDSRLGLFPG